MQRRRVAVLPSTAAAYRAECDAVDAQLADYVAAACAQLLEPDVHGLTAKSG